MPKGVYKRKPFTKEHKIKLGLANKGKKHQITSEKLKGNKNALGNKHTKKTKIIISDKLKKYFSKKENRLKISGKNCKTWKKEGIICAHKWIKKLKGKPKKCDICKTIKAKKYDWSNKNHLYKKIIKDWQRLFVRCHINWDIKYNNYRNFNKKI